MQTIYQIQEDKYAPYASMLQNMMAGYEKSFQEKRQRNMGNSDLQALQQYLANPYTNRQISPGSMQLNPMMSMSGSGGVFANPTMNPAQYRQVPNQLPQFQTPFGQDLAAKMLQQQMMSPLEMAQTEYTKRRLQNGNQEFNDAPWYMNDKYKNTPEAKIASGQEARAFGARMRIVKGADGYYGVDPTTGEQIKLDIPTGEDGTQFDDFMKDGGTDANSTQSDTSKVKYKIGDVVNVNGKKFKITGFDKSGEPIGEWQ